MATIPPKEKVPVSYVIKPIGYTDSKGKTVLRLNIPNLFTQLSGLTPEDRLQITMDPDDPTGFTVTKFSHIPVIAAIKSEYRQKNSAHKPKKQKTTKPKKPNSPKPTKSRETKTDPDFAESDDDGSKVTVKITSSEGTVEESLNSSDAFSTPKKDVDDLIENDATPSSSANDVATLVVDDDKNATEEEETDNFDDNELWKNLNVKETLAETAKTHEKVVEIKQAEESNQRKSKHDVEI